MAHTHEAALAQRNNPGPENALLQRVGPRGSGTAHLEEGENRKYSLARGKEGAGEEKKKIRERERSRRGNKKEKVGGRGREKESQGWGTEKSAGRGEAPGTGQALA